MKRLTAFSLLLALAAVGSQANAALVNITALDVRGTGVFGHDPNISAVTINDVAPSGTTVADPLNIQLTYSNLDLDGDSTANDSVTFTLTAAGGGGSQRAWGQGIDTGFGSLNNVTLSVSSVSGTTTDFGDTIVFDGFVGANAGLGGNGDFQRNVDINGTTVNLTTANTGAFEFVTRGIDFAPTSTVLFDNSGGTGGSIVARSYDLQFSTVAAVPEPSSFALLGLCGGAAVWRRRRKSSV
ncbi:PEP-CTERM sorting domain-containing protein [Crateriforma conspicua]|uniref:PEP-CTERM sorting domain-containing protein n=1 Tax=Crateriforma conspicua TaxID=2527996 RepID=UPI001189BEC6|nr:PEP-CTERM sorting domain-containing protein [Crateriforma conspicua]QDV62681.1 hypothetical protein Mal65_18160 [Crateriforma conspicua]